MEKEITFEKEKWYSDLELENHGLIKHKKLSSKRIMFRKDSFYYWFTYKRRFWTNKRLYQLLSIHESVNQVNKSN
jgi:hypothetical protein